LAVQFSALDEAVLVAETPCERLYSFCMQFCANAGTAKMAIASGATINENVLQHVLKLISPPQNWAAVSACLRLRVSFDVALLGENSHRSLFEPHNY
jgi:hypothetical protein